MKKTSAKLSLISIISVDLVLIVIALKSDLSITQLIWLYWCEGIIIGIIQSFKVFATEATTISIVQRLRPGDPPMALTGLFLLLQAPLHALFALWICYIDSEFDYVNGLLVMGAIIVAHELFFYLRDSRPWSEPDDLRNVIIESGIYFLRFIPVLALYHFMVKTEAGKGNMTLLTVEFMLFKLASDVISNLISGYLLKNQKN